ncbi:hypothetical protein FRC00_004123 [Tulasnella sp. 408]|nr:hypothetical protein FRC00_004123 [Tulasnella sp. 408]
MNIDITFYPHHLTIISPTSTPTGTSSATTGKLYHRGFLGASRPSIPGHSAHFPLFSSELGLSSQASDESSLYHDQDRELTRQRGLGRRRANGHDRFEGVRRSTTAGKPEFLLPPARSTAHDARSGNSHPSFTLTSTISQPPTTQHHLDDITASRPSRRRNFGIRPRVRPTTAPAAPSTPMSQRTLEEQREVEGAGVAEDVPEGHINGVALAPQKRMSMVVQDRDDKDEEDAEEDGTNGEDAVEATREDVPTAHLATDDKAALARLHQSTSAPSSPPALNSEDRGEQNLRPIVPAEEEIYELEGSGWSSHLPPPPSPVPPRLLSAPPAITSHTYSPPPPHEPSELPNYVAGPSAASLLGPRKLAALPSAPEDFVVTGTLSLLSGLQRLQRRTTKLLLVR